MQTKKPIKNELCLFGKIVLRGTIIVVPKKLRARVIELDQGLRQPGRVVRVPDLKSGIPSSIPALTTGGICSR